MKMKNYIGAAAAVLTAAALSLSISAQIVSSTGFRTESELVIAAKTPYDGKYTNIAWSTAESDSAGVPVPLSDSVIFPTGNKILKLDENTGEQLGSAEINEKVSTYCRGAAAGKCLLQPTRTGLAVINTESMSVECYRSFGGNIITDAAAVGNFGYVGVETGDSFSFICVNMVNLETLWEYSSNSPLTSPALFGDYVVFGAGSSLITHHYGSEEYTEIPVGTEIAGSPFAGEYAVYFSGSDGKSYKLRLNSDGTLEEDTLTCCETVGELSSPIAWNGRLYVASSEGFYILDSLNMDVITLLPDIKSGTDPIICYGNGPRVYLLYPDGEIWNFCCILDSEDIETPEVTLPARLENFYGGRLSVSAGGTMYFRDGIGRLFAAQVAPYNILFAAVKLVLLLALIVLVFLILRYWAKSRSAKKPPQY